MRRRRLLMVSHEYTLTGAPIVLLELARQLLPQYELLVASPADGPIRPQFTEAGVPAVVVAGLGIDARAVAGLLVTCDGLVANTLLSFAAVHAASQMGKPSAWYLHEGPGDGGRFLNHFAPHLAAALPLATRLVAPCRFVADLYAPIRGPAGRPIDIVPYGVDTPPVLPADDVPPARRPPLRLLQVGTLHPRKGQDVALAAVRLVAGKVDVTLDLVGASADPGFEQRLRVTSAMMPNVRYHGPADQAAVANHMAACDALIVPSRDEVTPVVILEAMARGRPVIAAAVGGVAEMFRDGEAGFLVRPDDPAHLADRITALAHTADRGKAMGRAGRSFVRASRTTDAFGGAFAALVAQLWPGPAGGPT